MAFHSNSDLEDGEIEEEDDIMINKNCQNLLKPLELKCNETKLEIKIEQDRKNQKRHHLREEKIEKRDYKKNKIQEEFKPTNDEEDDDYEFMFVRGASPPPIAHLEPYNHSGLYPIDTDNTSYYNNNSVTNHKKQEKYKSMLCKFYLLGFCAKETECFYMHNDFPCKYYYLGMTCVTKENEDCKFLHGKPLTEDLRQILLRHLTIAPKILLGEFPRLSHETVCKMIDATHKKLMIKYNNNNHTKTTKNNLLFVKSISDVRSQNCRENLKRLDKRHKEIQTTKLLKSKIKLTENYGDIDMRLPTPFGISNVTNFGISGGIDTDMRVLPLADNIKEISQPLFSEKHITELISLPPLSITYVQYNEIVTNEYENLENCDSDDQSGLQIDIDDED